MLFRPSLRSGVLLFATLLTSLAALSTAPIAAQTDGPDGKSDIDILREQGLEQSQVMDILSWICDVHGPRLTGSPNLRRAQQWALSTFKEWGLDNPHLESWGPFGKGWQMDHFNMEAVGENPWPIHAWPKAWSPSLERVEAEVVVIAGLDADEVKAMDLSDKIVLIQSPRAVTEPFDAEAQRHDAESLLALADGARRSSRGGRRSRSGDFRRNFNRAQSVRSLINEKRPLAILDRGSKGDYGTIFVSSASVSSPPGTPRSERPRPWNTKGHHVIPQFTLAVEHYNRICRLAAKGIPVRIAAELKTTFTDDDPMQYNVLAEIAGTDPELRDQVVMLGAHFDSWHSGTGATDNGAGSAVMMEAIRLIKKLIAETGQQPRRTIRVALWSGEEQGLMGSRAYVREHFGTQDEPEPEHSKLSGYFNLDNGTGRIRGVYMERNEAMAEIFRSWLRPFHDLDAHTLTLNTTGGTDHRSFDGVGLPGFQFIQDTVSYNTKTHHSNMDNWDHAVGEDLMQAATITAAFVWQTAQRDEMLPRKPPRQRETGRPRRGR